MNDRLVPTPIRLLLREQEPETRLQPIWRGILQRRARVAARPRYVRTAALALAAVVVVATTLGLWSVRKPSLFVRARYPVVPAHLVAGPKPVVQSLGDNSEVTLGESTHVEVLRQTTTQMLMALRRGSAHFDIRPGGDRAWVVECGRVAVEVVGTEFTLDRNERRLSVKVQRGRVLVHGELVPDTVQALTAGQELMIPYAESRNVTPESSATAQSEAVPSESTVVRVPSRQENADWRSAARQKDWARAWRTLGADGIGREASRSDDVSDLLALADVARLSGHPREAVLPLQQIMAGHSGDSRAAIAAFTLGKIQLDQLGEPAAAAGAFERALSSNLPGSLAEDTLARLVLAYARAHDSARARAAAERYRTQFPKGHRILDVERWSQGE